MDARLLDIITGLASLAVFVVLLMLPSFFPDLNNGYFYIATLALFIITMSVAGYIISQKMA